MELQNPEDVIQSAHPGEAMVALMRTTEPCKLPRSVLLLRTDPATLASLPSRNQMEIRASILRYGPVWVVPVLVRIAGAICQALYNHSGSEGPLWLANLLRQPALYVWVYDGSGEAIRRFMTPNRMLWFWQEILGLLSDAPSWTPAEWDVAVQEFLASYPTRAEFWEAIGRRPI